MSPLAAHLRDLIVRNGPITVARYMEEALGHPSLGYYVTRDPLGQAGDFTTAPEISQMFGEMIGLWCVATWQRMGEPASFVLAELGPGRGTLMADALRAARAAPGFGQAARLHLVETSPALREKQAANLAAHQPQWHATFNSVPEGPLLLVANEFFDALPIRQFARAADGWHERLVDYDAAQECFVFALAPEASRASLPDHAPAGAIAEVGEAGTAVTTAVAARIARHGGAALIVDYGYARPHGAHAWGDTLQALRRHQRHDPLEAPGDADLTAHVDFDALARVARDAGAAPHGPLPQGLLLKALGIELRALRLARNATPAQRSAIDAALHRLTHAEGMGLLFKALAIAHPALGAPDGFA